MNNYITKYLSKNILINTIFNKNLKYIVKNNIYLYKFIIYSYEYTGYLISNNAILTFHNIDIDYIMISLSGAKNKNNHILFDITDDNIKYYFRGSSKYISYYDINYIISFM